MLAGVVSEETPTGPFPPNIHRKIVYIIQRWLVIGRIVFKKVISTSRTARSSGKG